MLAAAGAIVVLAAAVQGSLGFGFSLVAAPVLVLVEPMLVPGPVIALLLALTVAMSVRECGRIDRVGAAWVVAGRLPGSLLGLAALTMLPATALVLGFVGVILIGVLLAACGVVVARRPRVLLLTGTLAGLMETTASIGGPPVALAYRTAAPPVARGTMSIIFVVGATISLLGLAAAGRFGVAELTITALLAPGVLLGLAISGPLRRVVDDGALAPAVLVLAAVSALVVAGRALW